MYEYTYWEGGREIIVRPPEGVRITDGPHKVAWDVPWPPGVHFYEVTDLWHQESYYRTTREAATLCNKRMQSFSWTYKKLKKKYGAGSVIIGHRWHIKRIPKWLFIQKTGRTHNVVYEYKYRW